jgi:hypothetical protein
MYFALSSAEGAAQAPSIPVITAAIDNVRKLRQGPLETIVFSCERRQYGKILEERA